LLAVPDARIYRPVQCEECWCLSEGAEGWIAKVVEADEDDPDAEPYVVTYCPECTEREFGA
jgi:hypothetical protein